MNNENNQNGSNNNQNKGNNKNNRSGLVAAIIATVLVFIFICLFSFYHLIQNRDKNYFCIPFFCGLMSSGSFLILQYSLLSYCLMYLHNNPINNTIEYE